MPTVQVGPIEAPLVSKRREPSLEAGWSVLHRSPTAIAQRLTVPSGPTSCTRLAPSSTTRLTIQSNQHGRSNPQTGRPKGLARSPGASPCRQKQIYRLALGLQMAGDRRPSPFCSSWASARMGISLIRIARNHRSFWPAHWSAWPTTTTRRRFPKLVRSPRSSTRFTIAIPISSAPFPIFLGSPIFAAHVCRPTANASTHCGPPWRIWNRPRAWDWTRPISSKRDFALGISRSAIGDAVAAEQPLQRVVKVSRGDDVPKPPPEFFEAAAALQESYLDQRGPSHLRQAIALNDVVLKKANLELEGARPNPASPGPDRCGTARRRTGAAGAGAGLGRSGGEARHNADPAQVDIAEERFQDAQRELEPLAGKPSGLDSLYPRQALFLLGVCYEVQKDYENALRKYSDVVRGFADSQEGLAANVRRAELLRKAQRWEEALDAYVKALEMIRPTGFSNRWLRLDEFRAIVVAAWDDLKRTRAYEFAVELAKHMRPLFPPEEAYQAVERVATANQLLASQLESEIADRPYRVRQQRNARAPRAMENERQGVCRPGRSPPRIAPVSRRPVDQRGALPAGARFSGRPRADDPLHQYAAPAALAAGVRAARRNPDGSWAGSTRRWTTSNGCWRNTRWTSRRFRRCTWSAPARLSEITPIAPCRPGSASCTNRISIPRPMNGRRRCSRWAGCNTRSP